MKHPKSSKRIARRRSTEERTVHARKGPVQAAASSGVTTDPRKKRRQDHTDALARRARLRGLGKRAHRKAIRSLTTADLLGYTDAVVREWEAGRLMGAKLAPIRRLSQALVRRLDARAAELL